ncbi:hypothetical protein BH23GEM9_BH23GEM9_31990 [soil metagenome]
MHESMRTRHDVPETVSRACTEGAGTVQALAEEVGVSYAALCSWSRGRRQPPPHRLDRLADVLEDRAERLRNLASELREQADAVQNAKKQGMEARPGGRSGATPHISPATREPRNRDEPLERAAKPAPGREAGRGERSDEERGQRHGRTD